MQLASLYQQLQSTNSSTACSVNTSRRQSKSWCTHWSRGFPALTSKPQHPFLSPLLPSGGSTGGLVGRSSLPCWHQIKCVLSVSEHYITQVPHVSWTLVIWFLHRSVTPLAWRATPAAGPRTATVSTKYLALTHKHDKRWLRPQCSNNSFAAILQIIR